MGPGNQECVTAIAFNQPELIFLAFGAPDVASGPSDSDEFIGVLPKVYECLDTTERSNFAVNMMSSTLKAAPFTGQHFLDTLPDSEVECLQTNLPAPLFTMIADAPSVAGGELQAAPPELLACISAESLGRIPSEILTHSMGVTSEASRACVLDFASAHGQYVELVQGLAEQAGDVSSEDSMEIAEGGKKLINCLADEELEQFQEKFLPTMLRSRCQKRLGGLVRPSPQLSCRTKTHHTRHRLAPKMPQQCYAYGQSVVKGHSRPASAFPGLFYCSWRACAAAFDGDKQHQRSSRSLR